MPPPTRLDKFQNDSSGNGIKQPRHCEPARAWQSPAAEAHGAASPREIAAVPLAGASVLSAQSSERVGGVMNPPYSGCQLTWTDTYFRNSQIAPISSLDTWAWEMCMDFATSIWVQPS